MTISLAPDRPPLGARAALAAASVRSCNWLSRSLGRGSGTVFGGRAGLLVDPGLLATLAEGRSIALVTGTNGKTTTTRLLLAALESGGGRVVSNDTGANMPAGHVAALVGALDAPTAVLEVDESYLGQVIEDVRPEVVVLLNLSRDQLDRIAEVRMLVDRWRGALGASAAGGGPAVVANADDPMVSWAAMAAGRVVWVGAGQVWHDDAVGCPACGGRIEFADQGAWSCERCDFARPARTAWVDGGEVVFDSGERLALDLRLPGSFNRANAAMALLAARAMPDVVDDGWPKAVLEGIGAVDEVAGRFSTANWHGRSLRLLLAKNPAGWTAVFELLEEPGRRDHQVVLSVNARIADGLDTSWLWDVPFERLAGRRVVATGERCRDLAVRLRYADVEHVVVDDPLDALGRAGELVAPGGTIEFLGNYTAFADLRGRL